ncbi:hypothetical protein WJX74_008326 [Apatococcus lobatus]|uniref:Gfo/Idh/MocA-like oxidoreductase N-terminal domain-containing protein n=1 Tax=Apatococcus lobatus TaxID=904363 RepID=A0AAW1SBK2_9CHLO
MAAGAPSTADSGKLRFGIVGAAAIAKKNVRGMKKLDCVEVVAVGSRSLDKAAAFIEETGLKATAMAFGSYEEVIADPRVQAVYMPLPAGLHVEWVKRACDHGKHVLLEKPIALTPEGADEIAAMCQAANVQLMDGTMFMHNPRVKEFESHLPSLGELKNFTSTFCWMGDDDFFQNDVRTQKGLDEHGCLGDIGWYCIRAMLMLFGWEKPVCVQAHAGPKFNKSGVLMHVGATIVYKDGKTGSLDCGFDHATTEAFQVAGTKGIMHCNDFCIPAREDRSTFTTSDAQFLTDLDTRMSQQTESHEVHLKLPQEAMMFKAFTELVRKVQAGEAPEQHWANISVMTQKIVCAIQLSAENDCQNVQLNL